MWWCINFISMSLVKTIKLVMCVGGEVNWRCSTCKKSLSPATFSCIRQIDKYRKIYRGQNENKKMLVNEMQETTYPKIAGWGPAEVIRVFPAFLPMLQWMVAKSITRTGTPTKCQILCSLQGICLFSTNQSELGRRVRAGNSLISNLWYECWLKVHLFLYSYRYNQPQIRSWSFSQAVSISCVGSVSIPGHRRTSKHMNEFTSATGLSLARRRCNWEAQL